MRLPFRIAGLALVALIVAIWAGWDLPRRTLLPSADDRAGKAAAGQAERLAHWLDNRPPAMNDAVWLARATIGDSHGAGTEVLSYAGRRTDGDAELVVRITVTGTFTDFITPETATATRCFRLRQQGRYGTFAVRGRDCAGRPALTLPPAPPEPELPAEFDQRLAAELRRLPVTGRTEPAVRAAADRALAGTPASVETAMSGRTVGLAVSADRDDCVLAAVDAEVDVWRPSGISLQPGEDGCNPATAASRG